MRIALVVVALVACKAKEQPAETAPVTADGAAVTSRTAPPREPRFPGYPECDRYQQVMDSLNACDRIPSEATRTLNQGFRAIKRTWVVDPSEEARIASNELCKQASDPIREILANNGCTVTVEAIADAPGKGSRDVPSEKGVPLDRAVLGAVPRPFGALQAIKPGMTRDEILAAVPGARRDDEDIVVPLGVETLTAKILIDTSEHISDIQIPMHPFPSELLEKAWGKSPNHVWLDRALMWRADRGDNESMLHIFPYKRFADVIGSGPDLLAEPTPMIGTSITKLKQRLGGRIDEWPDEDDEGNEVTRPRLLLPSTEICHFDSLYVLHVDGDTVTGATLSQCYDSDEDRKTALAAMEKKWGRATPSRGADDRLVFRFARPGRKVEMTEDPTVDPAGAWIVKIRR